MVAAAAWKGALAAANAGATVRSRGQGSNAPSAASALNGTRNFSEAAIQIQNRTRA